MRNLSLFALVLASVTACRGSSGDDTVTPDSNVTGDDTRIQDIQSDAMASGTEVKVKGVVVTAVDNFGGKKGDFWIEEPGGGEYSGVHVYGAPLEQVAALHVGDVVDVLGAQKDDFHYNGTNGAGGFPEGYAITELKPLDGGMMTVTKTGATMTITPDEVNALAIGQMADFMARDAEWEKWEGVLIKVTNVTAMSSDKCVGSQCPDTTNHSFDIVGGAIVESALGPMPTPSVKQGDCLGSVTGVLDYFFDYQILPRDIDGDGTTEDLAVQGGTCPTENQAATCGDGMDNDGDGFSDCNDNDCIVGVSSCRTVTTINALQTGTLPTGGIEIQNVLVAALSKPSGQTNPTSKNMWVQTNLAAAANEGIYVFGDGRSLNSYTPGTRVTIIGKVTEFNDMTGTEALTEINMLSIANGTGTTGAAVPLTGKNVTELSAEMYESTLVTLTNVQATTIGTTSGTNQTFGVGDAQQRPVTTILTFKTDDDMYLLNSTTTCYATITGIWTYLARNDAYGFLPLAAGTGTGTCN
jgi:hypothetical protein